MSAPVQQSPQSAPSTSQTEAVSDQVTNSHWSQRWSRWRPVVIALAIMLIPVLVTLWTRPITSKTPLAIDNPEKLGTMAVAELLRHEGISVSKTDSVSKAVEASRNGATIAVVNADRLSLAERKALAQAGGDVVTQGDQLVGGAENELPGMQDEGLIGVHLNQVGQVGLVCRGVDHRVPVVVEQAKQAIEPHINAGRLNEVAIQGIKLNTSSIQGGVDVAVTEQHDTIVAYSAPRQQPQSQTRGWPDAS